MTGFRGIHIGFWVGTTLAALLFRGCLNFVSPRFDYVSDHADFARWGMQAADDGVRSLYVQRPPSHEIRIWHESEWKVTRWNADRICNYPPLSTYFLRISGIAHRVLSDDRLLNTTLSRSLYSFWSALCDLLLALAGTFIVGRQVSRTMAMWCWVVLLFLPPLWLDSMIWGQWDAMVIAPTLWMLYFMMRWRFGVAGLLWGIALATKAQAVLFAPVWVLLVVPRESRKPALKGWLAACLTLLALAMPHLLSTGWEWWHQSYWKTVASSSGEYVQFTTLHAFNIWYVDLLLTAAEATDPILGMTRRSLGFLLAFLAAGGVWHRVLRPHTRDPRSLLLFAAMSLLAFVMLPTAVHERYLVIVLPYLLVCAFLWPRLWSPVAMLCLVATAQLTWPIWSHTLAGGAARGLEWGFTVISLLAAGLLGIGVYELTAIGSWRPEGWRKIDLRGPTDLG